MSSAHGKSFPSCLSHSPSVSAPNKLWPPFFIRCLPRQCIYILLQLPVPTSTLHRFLFHLGSVSEESCVQSAGLLLCLLIFFHVGKACFVLREESSGRWLAVMDSFVASQVILLTIPWARPSSVYCSESRVFNLLFSFLSFLKTYTVISQLLHSRQLAVLCMSSSSLFMSSRSCTTPPLEACSVPASEIAPSACEKFPGYFTPYYTAVLEGVVWFKSSMRTRGTEYWNTSLRWCSIYSGNWK